MHWGAERGYHKEQQFRKFKTPTQEADVVALSQAELKKIIKLDLTKNKRLDKVRDTFLFGCFTGQRYSDVANLKRENIKGKTWHLHTVKTNASLKIPLTDHALAILEKYKEAETVLPIMTNQKTNEYLKELCELAKINEPITITSYSGTKRTDTTVEKHQLITTHTARRTFVTLSLEKGMRPELVMAVTGHKDYATFRKYIKLTSKNTDIEVRKAWKLV
jgi:integrase